MYGAVALGGVELARLVGDGLQSIALVLKQRCADGKLGGVCVELKGVGEVRCCQDWCGCQSVLELNKGLGLHLAPSPSCVGAGDVGQRRRYVGEVVDKAPVEAREAQEAPELVGVSGFRPFTFLASTLMPAPLMVWPRKSSSAMPNWHLKALA